MQTCQGRARFVHDQTQFARNGLLFRLEAFHLSGGEFADGTGLSMLPWRKERRTGSEISLRPQRVNPLHFAKNPGQEIARDASIRSKSHDANNAVIRSRSGETRREDATLYKTLVTSKI